MPEKEAILRVLKGKVVSDKMDKTITVEVVRTVQHAVYNKYLKRKAKFLAHDESNQCVPGDVVEIVASKPYSKRKRFRLRKVLEKVVK